MSTCGVWEAVVILGGAHPGQMAEPVLWQLVLLEGRPGPPGISPQPHISLANLPLCGFFSEWRGSSEALAGRGCTAHGCSGERQEARPGGEKRSP